MMKKVIDIEERIPSMRERRRRRANRKFIFIVSIFLVALLSILYFQSSFSRIGKIQLIGASIHEPSVYLEKVVFKKEKDYGVLRRRRLKSVWLKLKVYKKSK